MSGEAAVLRVVAHLFRRTRVPLLTTVLATWIAGGIAVLQRLAAFTNTSVEVLLVLAGAIGAIGALGGLVLYWLVGEEVDFVRLGYRIRQLSPREYFRWTRGAKDWVYEELAEGAVRGLPFVRIVVDPGYPSTSDVLLPDESSWDDRVPPWACGRRAEIVERVLDAAGRSVTRLRAA
jgi:hypothetical protein